MMNYATLRAIPNPMQHCRLSSHRFAVHYTVLWLAALGLFACASPSNQAQLHTSPIATHAPGTSEAVFSLLAARSKNQAQGDTAQWTIPIAPGAAPEQTQYSYGLQTAKAMLSAATLPALALPAPSSSWLRAPLNSLPNWQGDDMLSAWIALQRSCQRLVARSNWAAFCGEVLLGNPSHSDQVRDLLERHLIAYVQSDEQGKTTGLATAYFEPIYNASLSREGLYQWPLYAAPEPMTQLSREQLTPSSTAGTPHHPILAGKELAWFDNPIDPFLAQIQGSLRIRTQDGMLYRLGFAGKNGHPYQSIANTLIRQGVFNANQASMERIKAWTLDKDHATVQAVLNTNPSFVFFKWLDIPAALGPLGAMSAPLTPMRSIAVDTQHTPLGVPVWLDTSTLQGALQQLMLAQDVGSAIKGAARVDIYTGTGDEAGKLASAQKNPAKVWVLWPKP